MNVGQATVRRLDRRDGLILILAPIVAFAIGRVFPGPTIDAGQLLAPAIPSPSGVASPLPPTSLALPAQGVEVPLPPIPSDKSGHLWSTSRLLLSAWSAAFLVIRWRRPRPPWRKLASQPGFAACGFGTLILTAQLGAIFLRWAAIWTWTAICYRAQNHIWMYFVPRSPIQMLGIWIRQGFLDSAAAGHAIVATWLIMLLGGWWRPEKSGIDRLGRALGAGWIALMVAGFFLD